MTHKQQYTSSARSIRYVRNSLQKKNSLSSVFAIIFRQQSCRLPTAINWHQRATVLYKPAPTVAKVLQYCFLMMLGVHGLVKWTTELYKPAPPAAKLTVLFMRSQTKRGNCLLLQHTPRTMVGTLFLEKPYKIQANRNKYLLLTAVEAQIRLFKAGVR